MRARCCSRGFTPDAQVLEASYESADHPRGSCHACAAAKKCGCIAERLFLLFCELTLSSTKSTTGAAMDSLRSALSIVPSGTAATIIVGHALLTKVMICVETNQ